MTLGVAACVALAGCAQLFGPRTAPPPDDPVAVETAVAATPRPETRPSAPAARVGTGGRTAEAFDTTTAAERVAAVTPPVRAGRDLGRTIASLGAPTEPGFWLVTPLVETAQDGRVTTASGATVRVELRPSGTAPGSGSQLSLAAFRALGLGLTDLPELTVALE